MGKELLKAIRKNRRDIEKALAEAKPHDRARLEEALAEAKRMEEEVKDHVG